MKTLEALNIGVVGLGGRGKSLKAACSALNVRVHAVGDVDPQRLAMAAVDLGADESYTSYEEMLLKSDLDAVIISTPMHLHATHALAALERGVHVLSEVTAAVSIQECRQLVNACAGAQVIYMLAENANYMTPNIVVAEMVRRGLFGATYYAEGEYLHELKALNENTPWRRQWQTGVDGITYGTHSLGPILRWMPGQRVTAVCCAGSGHHYSDPHGQLYENQDSCVMLCRLSSGELAKVRVDMLSNRPYGLNYTLQGTEGAYESARTHGGIHRVWLRSRAATEEDWQDLADLQDEFAPDWWLRHQQAAMGSGHDGSDYFVLLHFIEAINGRTFSPIGIHEALDMTLPGLVSQQSIVQNGVWLDVPDSRNW